MDPISAIFVMTVLGGLFVKGVDVATDGWFSAEVGAGVRGAGRYAVRAERARWGRARAKAREIRQRTPQGQAVQEVLDLAGLFGRTLFGELRQFGSGLRSEWETARDQARSARTERRGDAPWPIVRAARSGAVRARGWAERRARSAAAGDSFGGLFGSAPSERGPNAEAEPDVYRVTLTDAPTGSVRGEVAYLSSPEHGAQVIYEFERPDMGAATTEAVDMIHEESTKYGYPYRIEWVVNGEPSEQPSTPYGPDVPPDPNGDPNVPLPSTVPDANGDLKCGCCAQSHKPLTPGEHCPNCHIHDGPNAPTDTIQNAPTTKGPSMADINTAPAAIAAWEALGARWESLQSRADALHGEHDALKNEVDAFHGDVAALADGMGDFAIGGETDAAAAVGELSDSATSAKEQVDNLVGSMSTAKEGVDAYTDALHLEYDGPIEAAAGKAADVHSVMQEA